MVFGCVLLTVMKNNLSISLSAKLTLGNFGYSFSILKYLSVLVVSMMCLFIVTKWASREQSLGV